MSTLSLEKQQAVRETVREGYARIAESEQKSCCGPSSCCGADSTFDADQLAAAVGYAREDLSVLPEGANMGLSCGNPVALATLKPGEVVVDLGSGGGFDVFIAGKRLGATGKAIGVDMTPEMLSKARRNTAAYREATGLDNVEFRLGEIEHLPLPDNSADVIISNCVINLSPDKPQVWREIARVLKPGGRVSVSDIALMQPLPEEILAKVQALIGCIAGAVLVEETEKMMEEAGLSNISLARRSDYIDAMTDVQDPLYAEIAALLPPDAKASDYVTSLSATATKQGPCCAGSSCCS